MYLSKNYRIVYFVTILVINLRLIRMECDICQDNWVACHSENIFSLCVNGTATRADIPCPEGMVCTADYLACYPELEAVTSCPRKYVVPEDHINSCGVCNGPDKVFSCTSERKIAFCFGQDEPNYEYTAICPDGSVCDLRNKNEFCTDASEIEPSCILSDDFEGKTTIAEDDSTNDITVSTEMITIVTKNPAIPPTTTEMTTTKVKTTATESTSTESTTTEPITKESTGTESTTIDLISTETTTTQPTTIIKSTTSSTTTTIKSTITKNTSTESTTQTTSTTPNTTLATTTTTEKSTKPTTTQATTTTTTATSTTPNTTLATTTTTEESTKPTTTQATTVTTTAISTTPNTTLATTTTTEKSTITSTTQATTTATSTTPSTTLAITTTTEKSTITSTTESATISTTKPTTPSLATTKNPSTITTPITTTTQGTTTPRVPRDPTTLCKDMGEPGLSYPLDNDTTCTQFIMCYRSNGVLRGIILSCERNMFFNSEIGICQSEKPANCV